jgi:hypothetical protein
MRSSIDKIADAVGRIQELAIHDTYSETGQARIAYHSIRPDLLEILDCVAEIKGATKDILHD